VGWAAAIETFEGRVVAGEVVDVSTSGMRVRTAAELGVGAAVTARVALPKGAERLEVVARVTRRNAGEVALDFIGLPDTEARRVQLLLPSWEARRRSPRAHAPVPVTIDSPRDGSGPGRTLDLSAFAARVTTDVPLTAGDIVALALSPGTAAPDLKLRAVVWDVGPKGAVLVFVNLSRAEYRRLGEMVAGLLARER
jgi:hypothetical protein